jgi:hypothetical protein
MISIRFKDYWRDRSTFDRVFNKTAMTLTQAKLFEPVADACMDAVIYNANLNAQAQNSKDLEHKQDLERQVREFQEEFIKVKGYRPVPRKNLKWLKLAVDDYVILTKHKVIGE